MFKWILLILPVVIILPILFLKFIKIQRITCQSQYGQCNSSLLIGDTSIKNKNIFETRVQLNKFLKGNEIVLDYSIRFELPFNYRVYVIERKPTVAFLLRDGSFSLVDSDGVLVSNVQETNLPKITSSYDLDRDRLIYIAKLVSRLYTFYNVNTANVTEDGVTIKNLKGKDVVFPVAGDIDELLGGLNLILSRLPSTAEASTIRIIDLRYKNPVLK